MARDMFVLTKEHAEKNNFSEENAKLVDISKHNHEGYTADCVRVLCGDQCSLDDCDTSGPLFRT